MADDLFAISVASDFPTVGKPPFLDILAGSSIASDSPTVGNPVLDGLVASSLAAGLPALGAPDLGQIHGLVAVGVASGEPTTPAVVVRSRKPPHQILPPNSTPFERSLEFPQRRLMELPVPVRDLWRWDTCPVELIPWLAWAMSVDLWDHGWPEVQKRAIIRDSFELHRRKGTLWCVERYLKFAGATLKKAIVPPNKAFPGKSMTPEERKAWLDRFPQIRIFRFRDRGTRTYGAFASHGAYKQAKTYLGAGPASVPPSAGTATKATFFPYQTDAWVRWGRRAFLWDKGTHFLATGEETPLRWIERTRDEGSGIAVDYEQVLIPGSNVSSLFLGDFARGNHDRKNGRLFPVASAANARVVSLRRTSEYTTETDVLHRFALRPSLDPIQAFPEHVAEPGTSTLGMQIFGGVPGRWLNPKTLQRTVVKGYLQGFLPETTSRLRLFDRLYLHDPRRLPDGRPPGIYAGHFRLGQPPFVAVLHVEVKSKRTPYQFGRFVYGFTTAADRKPLELARKAVQRAKAHRDKILLRTRLHRQVSTAHRITTASGVTTGDFLAV